jgi:hypothetical protein
MTSQINPSNPAEKFAWTQLDRVNFRTAKEEIEALQTSTSPNGFKLAADTTINLGSPLGGADDGRIAYDTDKGVIVRDTESFPPGTPTWQELSQRRIRQGTTAQRPVHGSVPGAYVNLYWNTDTSKFQADTATGWVDVGPSTGTGGTLTEVVLPVMSSPGSQAVTHPAVPLTGVGSGEIRYSVIASVPGFSQQSSVSPSILEDLNTGGASWLQDVGTVRVFTGSAGVGTFNQGNFIYTGPSWAAATKKAEILFVEGTTAAPIIHYVLLGTPDFIASDPVVEWTGAADDATCTAGVPSDSLNFGHFFVDPGVEVVPYTFLWVTAPITGWSIVYKNGNGTAANSVGLSGAQVSTPIESIHGAFVWFANHLYPHYFSDSYLGLSFYATTPNIIWGYNTNYLTSIDIPNLGKVLGLRAYLSGTPGIGRAAISVDGGVTWLSFDNASQTWITITLSDLETNGLQVLSLAFPGSYVANNAGASIPADDGSASPPEGWGTLRTAMIAAGFGLDLSVAVGLRTFTNLLMSVENVVFEWRYPDAVCPHGLGPYIIGFGGYASSDFQIVRDSTTSTTFYRSGYGTDLENVHLQVWTA